MQCTFRSGPCKAAGRATCWVRRRYTESHVLLTITPMEPSSSGGFHDESTYATGMSSRKPGNMCVMIRNREGSGTGDLLGAVGYTRLVCASRTRIPMKAINSGTLHDESSYANYYMIKKPRGLVRLELARGTRCTTSLLKAAAFMLRHDGAFS